MTNKEPRSFSEKYGFHTLFEEDMVRQYPCRHCNTSYITNHQTSNEICAFCGHPATQAQRADNICAPSRVIPFLITKKKAEKIYKQWCCKVKFSPKDFGKKPSPAKLSSFYIPVLLCDVHALGNAVLDGRNTETVKEGKKRKKQTHYYKLVRDFDICFRHIPICGTNRISQKGLEALYPYRVSDLQNYSPKVLFEAKGLPLDVSESETKKQTIHSVTPCIDEYLMSQSPNYDTAHFKERNYDISITSMEYVWFPVFYGKFDFKDEEHIFIMNGQSGKIAFNPPISKIKAATGFGLLTLFFFLFFRIITLLSGGPLL